MEFIVGLLVGVVLILILDLPEVMRQKTEQDLINHLNRAVESGVARRLTQEEIDADEEDNDYE